MKNLLLISSLFLLSACTPMPNKTVPQTVQVNSYPHQTQADINTPQVPVNMDAKHKKMLKEGEAVLANKKAKLAIDQYFNPIIRDYQNTYKNSPKRLYNARTQKEYDFYMMNAQKEGKLAHVLSETWSKAYFLKAYALQELKNTALAKNVLTQALKLSPSNSKYLSEMGHILHIEKNWNQALQVYKSAEKSALFFSPQSEKQKELLRAKRGIGYSLVEMKHLAEAEKVYLEILQINPNDKIAKQELKYLQEIKNKHQ